MDIFKCGFFITIMASGSHNFFRKETIETSAENKLLYKLIKRRYLPHHWSVKCLKGTTVNRTCPFLNGGRRVICNDRPSKKLAKKNCVDYLMKLNKKFYIFKKQLIFNPIPIGLFLYNIDLGGGGMFSIPTFCS